MRCADEESDVLSYVRIPGWSWRVVTQFLAAASVLVQAGLLATCLSSDLGWVSCTVHTVQHCTLYTAGSCQLSSIAAITNYHIIMDTGHCSHSSCTQPPYSW